MKYNLKNRPVDFRLRERNVIIGMFEEWFESFEKELREAIRIFEGTTNARCLGRLELRKEILGE